MDRRAGSAGFGRGRRLAAQRVQIGRGQLVPDGPRKVEHFVDDAVEARHFLVDVGNRFAERRGAGAGLP